MFTTTKKKKKIGGIKKNGKESQKTQECLNHKGTNSFSQISLQMAFYHLLMTVFYINHEILL